MSLCAPLAAALLFAAPAAAPAAAPKEPTVDTAALKQMMGRFATTELKVDTSKLSAGDKLAAAKLIEASRVLDELFLRQLWSGNPETWAKVQKDAASGDELARLRRDYYWMNRGPFSSLDEHKSFVPGTPARKPMGAGFYPEDMTKEEFEAFVKTLPASQQELATGFFSVVLRGPDKKLVVVPYNLAYAPELGRMAALLKEAAAATENETLKKFLVARADAFLSNDYFASDVAWMDLDAPLDVTFGPYETYNDELFGYKAAFEAYVTLRDDAESAKLAAFGKHLQTIENALPIPEEHKNKKVAADSSIRVVQQIFASGDASHGVKSAAFNLPNDEKVILQKGAKRVMLKNVQEAKFNNVLLPISKIVLAKKEQGEVAFDPFFTHILAHELTHGLGPHQIKVDGKDTTPRESLKDLYSAIEEAKADVLGLFSLQYLMENSGKLKLGNLVPVGEKAERSMYVTFLASSFRTLRFGVHEAHGKGMALQVNYLMDKKGIVAKKDGTFSIDLPKFKAGLKDLAHDLLMLEAKGDRAGAQKMVDTLGVLRPEVQAALGKLTAIPIDVEPVFVTAEQLAPAKK